jgi:hypothetical protein
MKEQNESVRRQGSYFHNKSTSQRNLGCASISASGKNLIMMIDIYGVIHK